eukprot:CAMPEP_0170613220 /NCGR_PEP_ID=MMETSP0224-20130122/24155_1 /TAXON_ID=285029 /ORGANISM="Togula jolla, Strain CCCM 725" /LENGTH=176 /DNA_ID=CAMNT_0010938805 /DNA_START=25 /DNA_END=555 /DNA_ORIENTATION=-
MTEDVPPPGKLIEQSSVYQDDDRVAAPGSSQSKAPGEAASAPITSSSPPPWPDFVASESEEGPAEVAQGLRLLEGEWFREEDSFPMGHIKDGHVMWNTKFYKHAPSPLKMMTLNSVSMEVKNVAHIGVVEQHEEQVLDTTVEPGMERANSELRNLRLRWSDGEVWVRTQVDRKFLR